MPFLGARQESVARSTVGIDELRSIALGLVAELDDFAFKSERVLARLDMRAARRARDISASLRGLVASVGPDPVDGESSAMFSILLDRAVALLSSWDRPPSPATVKAIARTFDDPEETTNPGLTDAARRELLSSAE